MFKTALTAVAVFGGNVLKSAIKNRPTPYKTVSGAIEKNMAPESFKVLKNLTKTIVPKIELKTEQPIATHAQTEKFILKPFSVGITPSKIYLESMVAGIVKTMFKIKNIFVDNLIPLFC